MRPPTRLLDLHSIYPNARLVNTDPNCTYRYVALSYCWGSPTATPRGQQEYRLLYPHVSAEDGTWREHTSCIIVNGMPQLLQEAITVARAVGIDFIWVDALCIVQNDALDKDNELRRMGEYYHGAEFTLAASNAAGVQESFLRRDNVKWMPHAFTLLSEDYSYPHMKQPERKVVRAGLAHRQQDPRRLILEGPLWSRAWTYQENALSRRVIHFDEADDIWECRQEIVIAARNGDGESDINQLKMTPLCRMIGSGEWESVVETYTSRLLTYPSDKLPAISALAERMAGRLESEYVAGLMKEQLSRRALWWYRRVDNPLLSVKSVPLFTSLLPTSPATSYTNTDKELYIAPSWSWASIDGPVIYPNSSFSGYILIIRDVKCVLKTHQGPNPNPFGELSGGSITIFGNWCPAELRYSKSDLPIEDSISQSYKLHESWGRKSKVVVDAHIRPVSLEDGKGQRKTGRRSNEPHPTSFSIPVYSVFGACFDEDLEAKGTSIVHLSLILGIDVSNGGPCAPERFVRLGMSFYKLRRSPLFDGHRDRSREFTVV